MESIARDVRFAIRTLLRRPGFTLVAVVTLGLGIGTTTAMFTVVEDVLLQSVPFREPDRLVNVWLTSEEARGAPGLIGESWNRIPIATSEYLAWSTEHPAFDAVAVQSAAEGILAGADHADRVSVGYGSASLLELLGVAPERGRWFAPEEEGSEAREASRVVVLSYDTWRDHMSSDPRIVGREVVLNGESRTVIGVLPRGFRLRYLGMHLEGEDRTGARDLWVPMGGTRVPWSGNNLEAIGRIAKGATEQDAVEAVGRILLTHREAGDGVRVVARREDETRGWALPLFLLLAATGILFLIACANLSTLTLGELPGRRGEFSIRMALGAGRLRIGRQVFLENIVLGIAGSLVGLVVAYALTDALKVFAPPIPRMDVMAMDGRVLGMAMGTGVLAGCLMGILPAAVSARFPFGGLVRRSGSRLGHRGGFERWLTSSEIALTVVLLVAGGLLGRSLLSLLAVEPGFDPDGLATVQVYLPESEYADADELPARYDELVARFSALPGVVNVTAASRLPFPGLANTVTLRAHGPRAGEVAEFSAQQVYVLPGYHRVMAIPLLAGDPLPGGRAGSGVRGMLVNAALARRYWPSGTPIGARIEQPRGPIDIVGVVDDVKRHSLGADADRTFYMSLRDVPLREVSFVARTRRDPAAVAAEMRGEVYRMSPGIPVTQVTTLKRLIVQSTAQERYRSLLVALFGFLATVMAAVGVSGVVLRSIAHRTQELGVRMSLGAEAGLLVRRELWRALSNGLLGVASGLALAAVAARFMSPFLFGIAPGDPVTFGSVASVLVVVVLGASYFPARRITRVDPARVLGAD